MQIMYIIERLSGKGGLQRIIIDKASYLAEHTNHEVLLMTVWHDDTPLAYPLSSKVRRIQLNVPLPKVPFGYMPMLPLVLKRFNSVMKSINPDVAILFRAVGAFLIGRSSWQGRMVFESHSSYKHSNHNWLYKRMQEKADTVVCLTHADAEAFDKARHVEVIPNFTHIHSDEPAPLTAKRCIAVGRLCYEKNFSRLLKVWEKVAMYNPDWKLDIFGEGEEHEMLLQQIKDRGIEQSVTLCGTTTDITAEYLSSSILIMTSRTEGLPLTLIEAQTCGVPVVSFDCEHGPADIIENDNNGFLIPYPDDEAMVKAIDMLMKDEALRKMIGAQARIDATRYQPAPIMAQWLKVLTKEN